MVIFKEKESTDILKLLGLTEWKFHVYLINVIDKKASQIFKLKNMNETKNYLIEEIKQNKLIRKKHRRF